MGIALLYPFLWAEPQRPLIFHKFVAMLWIRVGVTADPDPAFFYLSAEWDLKKEAKPMRIRIVAALFRHKKLIFYMKNIL